jgi:hypothetical protein
MGEAYGGNSRSSLPPITDGASFLAEPAALPYELIHGILHCGSKMAIGGGSKSYKTWMLIHLAVSVAAGQPWIGRGTTRGKVLYCNLEIQPGFFRQRILAVCRRLGVDLAPGQLDVWNLRGHAASYETLLPEILRLVRAEGYALIVLDPIYKLYGSADENSARDVARLMNGIEELSVRTGAAVAFAAHYSKGNQSSKESIDRMSGSGVFARDPDSILSLTRHEEDDAFTVEATLRNFKPLDPFVVRWVYPTMSVDGTLDPAQLRKSGGRPSEHDPSELMRALPETGLTVKEWMAATDVPKTTFYRLRRALEEQGEAVNREGRWFPAPTCVIPAGLKTSQNSPSSKTPTKSGDSQNVPKRPKTDSGTCGISGTSFVPESHIPMVMGIWDSPECKDARTPVPAPESDAASAYTIPEKHDTEAT